MTWDLIFLNKVWNYCPERYGKFQSETPFSSGAICEKHWWGARVKTAPVAAILVNPCSGRNWRNMTSLCRYSLRTAGEIESYFWHNVWNCWPDSHDKFRVAICSSNGDMLLFRPLFRPPDPTVFLTICGWHRNFTYTWRICRDAGAGGGSRGNLTPQLGSFEGAAPPPQLWTVNDPVSWVSWPQRKNSFSKLPQKNPITGPVYMSKAPRSTEYFDRGVSENFV